jgi:hypothetical protein
MTPERARAYQRVVRTVREIGPSSLLNDEQQRLREAADHLIFTSDLDADVAARMALMDTDRLCRALIESGRWEQGRAMRLAKDVAACGPVLAPELRAA